MAQMLQTARLALREMTLDDLDFVATMLGDAEVMRFYPRSLDRDEARWWLERQLMRYGRDGHGLWLVEERETGAPVGQVGLLLQEVEGAALHEIGYLLHRPFWKRGFATEAARGVRDFAFGRLQLSSVISLIRPENTPSQAVAMRLGMRAQRRVTWGGTGHDVWVLEPSTREVS
jgi:[ribosomal protein S5]-alanine N-acetyltransferase